METLLDILRRDTSTLHQALHEHPLLVSCQEGTMDKSGYIKMLKAFYSPWKLLIPQIESVPLKSLRPKLTVRSQAILSDLVSLGEDQVSLQNIPVDHSLTEDELLGMCYVLIGSSMGATTLSTSIKSSLGDVPVSYMSMSPKASGWPELVTTLRTLDSKKHSSTAKYALNTFSLIEAGLG